jgi:hypothetical protein
MTGLVVSGVQQSNRLCDRIAHPAVWLYPRECLLHKRIQSSDMVKGAEGSIRIDGRRMQRTAHWLQTNEHP